MGMPAYVFHRFYNEKRVIDFLFVSLEDEAIPQGVYW